MKHTLNIFVAALLTGLAGCRNLESVSTRAESRFVDSFDLTGATCGLGLSVRAGASVDGNPLSVAGKKFAHGFGTHPQSAVVFVSNGRVKSFDARVGIDDEVAGHKTAYNQPAARFRVWADGVIVADSKSVQIGQQPVALHADLSGAREIILETTDGAPWSLFDAAHADWLDATFACEAGATLRADNDPARFEQLGILTPAEKKEPRINGADIWGVRPGHPVLFRVPTTGERPIAFSAKNLPRGVILDEKGVLRGTAPAAGNYDISVTAKNAYGTATRTIRLAVGETLALTPPMGWNSWNTLCYRLTQEKAMAAALAMEKSGLGNHGYAYINLDDWWMMNNSKVERVQTRQKDFGGREDVIGPARDANGKVLPNRSFPDMKAFTDYVHSFGFKAGLYSSPGPLTCGQCEGSYGHEAQDAASWADWGFDYVKYDWCSYNKIFKKETGIDRPIFHPDTWTNMTYREAFMKPYRILGEALRRQKRDIVFSFCQYGMGEAHSWGASLGGNTFRCWDDLKDCWSWMETGLEGTRKGGYADINRPGWWADPDMMLVGQQYSFGHDHPTYLTHNEQYTHVSLWAMVGSPILIGCDLTTIDAFTRNVLANDEVIAVSQDRLGKTARRIRQLDGEAVWVRPLSNGFKAVALVNRSPVAREIKVSLAELGLGGECWVKDLWRQKCEGKHADFYVAFVPPHATKLVKMRPVDCPKCE